MDFRNSFQLPHFDATDSGKRFGLPETAPSAAWQAAQNAFSALEPKQAVAPPVVIRRKSRISVLAPAVVDRDDSPQTNSTAAKTPRVFRVETADGRAQTDKPVCNGSVESPRASAHGLAHGLAPKRTRQRRAVQAPGRLVLEPYQYQAFSQVHPQTEPVAGPALSSPIGEGRLSLAQIDELNSRLFEVGRTLGQIQSAADFKLIDVTAERDWHSLDIDLRRLRTIANRLAAPARQQR